MWKECKIVLLLVTPNDETSKGIWISKDRNWYFMYVVSLDEEIKSGDWCINVNKDTLYQPNCLGDTSGWNKVIATNDSSLQYAIDKSPYPMEVYGLPQIPQQFIEEYIDYNRGNVIEKVQVEYYPADEEWNDETGSYEIPEALKIDTNNFISIKREKKSYTREEVTEICKNAWYAGCNWKIADINEDLYDEKNKDITLVQWLKQNLL